VSAEDDEWHVNEACGAHVVYTYAPGLTHIEQYHPARLFLLKYICKVGNVSLKCVLSSPTLSLGDEANDVRTGNTRYSTHTHTGARVQKHVNHISNADYTVKRNQASVQVNLSCGTN
jgi:hypothetical protein